MLIAATLVFGAYRWYRAGDTKETFSFDAKHIVSVRGKVLSNPDHQFEETEFVDLLAYKDLIEALFSPAVGFTTVRPYDTRACVIELLDEEGGRKQLIVLERGVGNAEFTIDQGRTVFMGGGDRYPLDRKWTQFVDESPILCSLITSIATKDFDEEMVAVAQFRIALGLQPPAK